MVDPTGKYQYERLGEKPFQKLCGALLAHRFPGVHCFPVGHRDGGRDAVLPQPGGKSVVFQVKWTGDPLRDPVGWLTRTVREEAANIRRLVEAGASEYHLLTSVAGTAVPGSGTIDRLDAELARYAAEFGIPVTAWWRSDLDAWLDGAPDAVKWSYPDMLTGHDLVRSVNAGGRSGPGLHELVRKAVATQWEEDSKVKFKQAELTSHDLVDLFVDVEAVRLASPGALGTLNTADASDAPGAQDAPVQDELGGAAAYLLTTRRPFTLVRGAPGQGKSTLGQYLCQVHRAALLDRRVPGLATLPERATARVPLRVDLRDYAAWLEGGDPLDEHVRSGPDTWHGPSLESFLAYLLRALSGGHLVDVPTVGEIVARFPVLLLLDGLDEVARAETRSTVVKHVNEFCARLPCGAVPPQVVVTTRPNAAALAEPTSALFETVELNRLEQELRDDYLQKWATARSVTDRDRRALERAFHQRSAEPHIAQLSSNPMQLTILLHLLHRRGVSVPTGRTELYTSYLETFLDREAEKSLPVARHRAHLEEVTAFLGWRLQADAERRGADGRITLRKLRSAIHTYLFESDRPDVHVDVLFTAVTDRVWALTSKVQGTFEFDIQPLREYFAARFLYEFAGAGQRGFDSSRVLRELVRRPYWSEVARFYAGFARPNELGGLVDALAEEKETSPHPIQAIMASWSLLADGVFSALPRTRKRAVELFLDDLSVCVLALQLRTYSSLPIVPVEQGGRELARALLTTVERAPHAPSAGDRVFLASRLLSESSEFESWWVDRLRAAAGSAEETRWLHLGELRWRKQPLPIGDLPILTSGDTTAAARALAAGLYPAEGSAAEAVTVRSVLAGQCRGVAPLGVCLPMDLLYVLPLHGIQSTYTRYETVRGKRWGSPPLRNTRKEAWQRLIARNERLAAVETAVPSPGEPVPWEDLAQALNHAFGPCWLAAEAAVIAAAERSLLPGEPRTPAPRTEAFGPQADYRSLVDGAHRHRDTPGWWVEQFERHDDPLSRATWSLALVVVAGPAVVTELTSRLDEAVASLPAPELRALLATTATLNSGATIARPSPRTAPATVTGVGPTTALLLSHHEHHAGAESLLHLSIEQLTSLGEFGAASPFAAALLIDQLGDLAPERIRAALRPFLDDMPFWSLGSPTPRYLDRVDLYRDVLDHPAEYPRRWLWSFSHQRLSRPAIGRVLPRLAEVADAEGWFAFD
ncbi:NACHT domain-containing protein [Kitasatospora phosalacinea]|uniref:NACHT domain-containing protein n=1 Tax=Kitasatospora phosalacinea TaxID=2065 RepID=A0ABW6GQE0_9ACTN